MAIEDFKVNMISFARPSLFRVEVFKSMDPAMERSFTFKCHTAQIPGLEIATTDADAGYRSFAYQKIYTDVSMSFYCREDMLELKYFQDWMKKMIRPHDNHVGYYKDYVSNIKIVKLDRQQKQVMETTLFDAYPKGIDAMELNFGSTEVMSVAVKFTYRDYEQKFVDAPIKETKQGELGDNTESSAEDFGSDIDKKTKTLRTSKLGKPKTIFDTIGNGSSGSFG